MFSNTVDEEVLVDQASFYNYANKDKEPTMNYVGAGYYQCYCKEFSSMADFANSVTSSEDPEAEAGVQEEFDAEEELKQNTATLCNEFIYDGGWGFFLTNFVTFLVSAINYAIAIFNQTADRKSVV